MPHGGPWARDFWGYDAFAQFLANPPDDAMGLAVPGMPVGSPGMEVEGAADQPYDVIAFDKAGYYEVFASYGQ